MSKARAVIATDNVPSVMAKMLPLQRCGPAPKGVQAWSSLVDLTRLKSDRDRSSPGDFVERPEQMWSGWHRRDL